MLLGNGVAVGPDTRIHPTFVCMWRRRHRMPIKLNAKAFNVNENLYTALMHVRKVLRRNAPLRLWVDALCINQADIVERIQQVRSMVDIFRRARMIIALWGPSYEDSDLAAIAAGPMAKYRAGISLMQALPRTLYGL
jgi:hypothetical protein